jgi:hypothetical protein
MILRDAEIFVSLIKVLLLYSGPVALAQLPVTKIIIRGLTAWRHE